MPTVLEEPKTDAITVPAVATYAPHIKTELTDSTKVDRIKANVLSDRKVQLDKTQAFKFLEMPTFRGERGVVEGHAQALCDEMRRGRFLDDLVVIATCMLDDVEYRINGQHTCWARTSMQDSYQCTVRWIRYKVLNEDQMRALYTAFDAGLPRNHGHRVKVLLAGSSATDGITDSLISTIGSAWKFWRFEKKNEQIHISANDIANQICEAAGLVRAVGAFYQAYRDNRFIRRRSVLAAMLATFDKVPSKADMFWLPVVNGLGMSSLDDPRYRLRDYLMDSGLHKATGSSKTRVVSEEEMYRTCIVAWNKWRNDETVKMLRTTSNRVKPV